MIIPAHCKQVGFASSKPYDDRVYFLSRYLIRAMPDGYEILRVTPADGSGLLRDVAETEVLARPDEVAVCPRRVNLHDRADLIRRAAASGRRCTVFTGHDEHMTFVLDPDESVLLTVHVYDIMPPRPHLAMTIKELDATGIFGHLLVRFAYHCHDIRTADAEIFPCRAAGFARTLDADRPAPGERVACCLTGRQLLLETGAGAQPAEDICPLARVEEEPFIARCCRSERTGSPAWNGRAGAIVHWGSSPKEIADAVEDCVRRWREGP